MCGQIFGSELIFFFLLCLKLAHGYSNHFRQILYGNKLPCKSFPDENSRNFIINGNVVKPGKFLGMVSLRYKNGVHFCGGSIITDYWILTAAHCMNEPFWIMAGEHILLPMGLVRNWHKPVIAHVHAEYRNDNLYDLAIIKVKPRFKIHKKYLNWYPIIDYEVQIGTNCQLAGWGQTWRPQVKTFDNIKKPLHYVNMTVIDLGENPSMILAIDPTNEASACKGDSGSGLMCDGKLAGVIFGVEQENCTGFGAHISTYHFFPWIADTIKCETKPECRDTLVALNVGSKKHPQVFLVPIQLFVFFFIHAYFFQ